MDTKELNGIFDELLKNSLGKQIEVVDPNSPYQCFDWALRWTDTLVIPRVFPFVPAYEIYTKFGPEQARYFDQIPATPHFVPIKGDLMVFGTAVGPQGHVSVATGHGDEAVSESSDQNWNGVQSVQLIKHNKTGLLGVLRPKVTNSTNPMQDNIVRKSGFYDKRWLAEYPGVNTDLITEQDNSDQITLDQNRKSGNGKWGDFIKLVYGESADSTKITAQQAYEKAKQGCSKKEIVRKVNEALQKAL